jgi:hypothetical protein
MTEFEQLEALDVPIAYVNRMPRAALWLPDDCVVVLNAQETRDQLAQALRKLMPLILDAREGARKGRDRNL